MNRWIAVHPHYFEATVFATREEAQEHVRATIRTMVGDGELEESDFDLVDELVAQEGKLGVGATSGSHDCSVYPADHTRYEFFFPTVGQPVGAVVEKVYTERLG